MSGCMKSRNSYLFRLNVKEWFSDNSTLHNHVNFSNNLNFSATYWQPFIDLAHHESSDLYEISGPFLGILFEIAKYLKFSITYVGPPEAPFQHYFFDLNIGRADIFLNPTPPLELLWWELFQPSVAFSEVCEFFKYFFKYFIAS